jgi:hypothetical protein
MVPFFADIDADDEFGYDDEFTAEDLRHLDKIELAYTGMFFSFSPERHSFLDF